MGTGFLFKINAARYSSGSNTSPASRSGTVRPSRISRLGDEKLHYYGISYGTWLGFWYAGLFPERAGPMVLDSNMNFSRSIHEASIASKQGQALTFKNSSPPMQPGMTTCRAWAPMPPW